MKTNSKGYVITADVSSIRDIICDEVWQITRSSKHISGTVWVPELAPSSQLFEKYLKEWKDNPVEEWWYLYKDAFNKELKSAKKLGALKKLGRLVESGRIIALICFCRDSDHCHRALVGELLKQCGVEVEEYVKKKKTETHTYVEQLTLF
ncbi:MAG TPA: hypothetical protein DD719_03475 [Desulfotomaculum sp.]|jgi:uncharacterized protein YeaO (DUF488 family)|nr:hypothetical protein [Desulfotomaculum sp.]HCJ78743.1 hypothetical protein [Desulfotomaculum sp.]